MAEEEELPDWLKPSKPLEPKQAIQLPEREGAVEEELPDWLKADTQPQLDPPPTPAVPVDEEETSWWGNFSKWKAAGRVALEMQPAAKSWVRTGVRASEDLFNAVNEVVPFGQEVKWEDEWLGKPEGAVADITAEIGSWATHFFIPGAAVAKVPTVASKMPAVSSTVAKLTGLIGKTKKGEKALQVSKIALEGAGRGLVADYLATDVDDMEADAALEKRLTESYKGLAIGSALNLTTFGAGKIIGAQVNRLSALRKIKKANEGKADPVEALQALKKSVEEEVALKEDLLSNIKPVDDRVDPTQSFDDVVKSLEEPTPPKPEVTKEEVKVEKPVVDPELELEDIINRGKSLPDKIDALVRFNVALDGEMTPKINTLVESLTAFDEQIEKGVRAGLTDQYKSIQDGVVELATDLKRYRKMIELRAKAANLTGKSLGAFKGKNMDFSKPITYKPAVLKQFDSIDRLLGLVDGIKSGELTSEKLLTGLRRELDNADELSKTGDLKKAVDKEFDALTDENIPTIWDKYKNRISEQVLRTLRLSKDTNKAALDMFSTSVTKNLKEAVQPNKPLARKVASTLDDLQDILANPEKYKESIDVIIKDISEATNLNPEASARALRILNDLKEGTKGERFIAGLPQRDKLIQKVLKEETANIGKQIKDAINNGTEKQLVDNVISDISTRITSLGYHEKKALIDSIRVELANSVTAMREKIIGNFMSKEIYQKYALKQTIEELDEMSDKSLAEIKEYLGKTAKRVEAVPEDIKRLQQQARESKKVLTDKLKEEEVAAYNEFIGEFLQALGRMDAFGMEEMGNFELFLRAAEKFRLNALLFSVRTWTVGLFSAGFNMVHQPFRQAWKKYAEITFKQRAGLVGPEVSALQAAKNELVAMTEYTNNWTDMLNILKATWKQHGQGAFNAKSFRRHEEDLIAKTTTDEVDAIKKGPIKLNFKNREHTRRLVNKYGRDNARTKKLYRRFLEDIVEGEPTTNIGKWLDPLFSISFRNMGMADQPFVFLGTMRALRADGLQEGLVKGLEGEALEKFVKEHMQSALKREGDVLQWANNEKFNEVSELGFAMVYQQEYSDKIISKIAQGFSNYSRSGTGFDYYRPDKAAARFFVPFLKTPTAIAQWTVDNMPVVSHGYFANAMLNNNKSARELKKVIQTINENNQALKAKPITKNEIKRIEGDNDNLMAQKEELVLKDAEEKAEAAANAMSASVMAIGATTAVMSGNITGSGAHLNDDQKKRLRDAGWRPNSLYIGGKVIDYGRMEPFSTLLSTYADLLHYLSMTGQEATLDDKEFYDVVLSSFVHNFSNKYFLRGLQSVFGLLDTRKGEAQAENLIIDGVSSLSPTIIRDLNQMNQEFQTKAHGFKEKLLERSLGIQPGQFDRNLLGEKVDRKYTMEGVWGIVSPIFFSKDERDPILTEVANIREDIGQRLVYKKSDVQAIDTREYRNPSTGLSLFDTWMDEMSEVKVNSKTLRQELKSLFKTKEYKDAPNFEVPGDKDTKGGKVKKVLERYRNKAWDNMLKSRKIRKYENADEQRWYDVFTGKTLLTETPTKDLPGLAEQQMPKQ